MNDDTVEIRPAFSLDYRRARDLLDGASMLSGPQDPSGPIGGLGLMGYIMDGSINLRTLRVHAEKEAEARALLDAHGIVLVGGEGDTVIDVSELNCPSCGAVLQAQRSPGVIARCEGCDLAFTWIDVTAS
ncbi:MAG: hypothetical protein CMJ29_01380 [Phycisphaerae bacterium]|nr:hypothetical protein [Phycisphaerae bacterium]|tara:strand:- start:2384 stop:2773 length:390 start_codon:yes stop_codon:yes gene_type:complete